MIDFVEICRRTTSGPLISETKFDTELFFPKIMELVSKYEIQPDLENPVNRDNGVADAIYQAAVDLMVETGVYCPDTQRIIEISRDEVLTGIREAPGPCYFGEDQDRRLYPVRKPEDYDTPAWCHSGGSLPCSSEEQAFKTVEGLARIKEADSVTMPSVMNLRETPLIAGSPQGLLACIRAVEIARAACRQAGRPGLAYLNCLPGAGSALETIGASCPEFGLRPSDGWIIGFRAEMKADYGALTKCAFLQSLNGRIGSQGAPIIGGYCGGPAGAAVTNCAYTIAGIIVMKGRFHLSFPIDMNLGVTGTRGVLWAVSASSQAISRNIAYPFHTVPYPNGGPMTESYFYEVAAHHLTAVVSGSSAQTGLPTKGTTIDHMTPVEFKFASEVIKCAHKLSREEANEIVKKLVPKYEDSLAAPNIGKSYKEVTDIKTGYPIPEYIEFYEKIKEEIKSLGVPFNY